MWRCVWRGEGRTFGTQLWEAPRQPLHNCVSAGLARHLVAFSRCVRYRIDMSRCITLCGLQPMQRSVRHSETMTGGVHFSNHGGGWRRAKPRISPRVGEATCGACQIAPVHNRTPEVVRGCASAVVRCVSSCVPHGCVCNDGLPPPPGWHIGVPFVSPRMSPTPRSAKYGATHGANRLPGLEITSPWVFSPLQAEWRRRHPMPDGASPL